MNDAWAAAMETEEDLAAGIAYMKEHCEKIGRVGLPDVILGSITSPGEKWSTQRLVDRLSRFGELGVGGAAISVDGHTRREWCDNAERMGENVIAKLSSKS